MAIPAAHVLVVDDEQGIRSSLARALTLMGFEADEAASGPQALAMVDATPYDVAIVDIVMLEMDGIEVLRQMRQKHPDMPVILISSMITAESAVAGIELGAPPGSPIFGLLGSVRDRPDLRFWARSETDPSVSGPSVFSMLLRPAAAAGL